MGAGIAAVLALAGDETTVVVRREAAVEEAHERIRARLDAHARLGLVPPRAAAEAASLVEGRLGLGGGPYDLVVESIDEDATAKRDVLSRAEDELEDDGLLCTNTSSLALAELAPALADPGRFAGWHWFNPPDLVELVEVVPGPQTRPETLERLVEWTRALGKTPVVLARDIDGFVANRLQYALLREAYALVEAGVCSTADVDAVVSRGLGARWAAIGPFEAMDLAGLDVHAAVTRALFPKLSRSTEVPQLLEKVRASGDRLAGGATSAADLVERRDRTLAARLRRRSPLVPAAFALPSNLEYLAHLEVSAADPELIRLASNENTEPPSPRVAAALTRAYQDANLSPPSFPPLRHALAERYGVEPAGVIVGAGSTELIEAAIRTFVRAGDEVVLPAPSWPVYRRRLQALEARIVDVPLAARGDAYEYELDALLGAITPATTLLVVCTPNNPTGNSLSTDDLRRCAEAAPQVLVDAAYVDFEPGADHSSLLREHENVLLFRTFSKAYCLAGLRVGYALGPPAVLDYVDRFLVPGGSVSSASLHAGLAALEDDDHHDRQVERIVRERERVREGLRGLGLAAYRSNGNFVCVDAASQGGSAAFAGELLSRRIVVRKMNEALVRITVGRSDENDAVLAAVADLASSAA